MASTQALVSDALNAVNQLIQYSIQGGPNNRSSNEFARSYKAAMQKLAAAAAALAADQATLLSTLANVGGGAQIFKDKVAQLANLRTLVAGANITLTQNADTIEVAASGGGPAASVINDIAAVGAAYSVDEAEITGYDLVRITAVAGTNFTIILPADPGGVAAFTPGTRVQILWDSIPGAAFDAVVSAPGLLSPAGVTNISWSSFANGAIATLRYEGDDVWSWEGCPKFITVV